MNVSVEREWAVENSRLSSTGATSRGSTGCGLSGNEADGSKGKGGERETHVDGVERGMWVN